MPALTEPYLGPSTIDLIVRRAGTLYSLPAVAVEVLRLSEQPQSDVRALRECLQQDPALTAKVLRVVNSSLFGLPQQVGNLNEAVALLGVKQLKLLVLGFSLPEQLFLDVAGEQLRWYWRTTLARAVAAREVSEQLFRRAGDEAFLAGMLQDLGVLVLLRELGGPYAALVGEAIAYRAELVALEQENLGFDHVQLTAGLLAHWNMPSALVRAIAEPRAAKRIAKGRDDHAPLAQVLHLAELLAQLVGQHRLTVLPDLLEAGHEYCELDRARLNDLVATLEPKVQQLAGVLSLDLAGGADYAHILRQAHEAMARVAESIAGPADVAAADRLRDVRKSRPAARTVSMHELHAAVEQFLERPTPAAGPSASEPKSTRETWSRSELRTTPAPVAAAAEPPPEARPAAAGLPSLTLEGLGQNDLDLKLMVAVGQCRAARQPLSVVLLGIDAPAPLPAEQARTVDRLLEAACRGAVRGDGAAPRRVLLLAGSDRQEAVAAARTLVDRLKQLLEPLHRAGQMAACVVAAGVASVVEPPKNFRGGQLLETAQRCLAAALTSGGVKSLEVM